MSFEYTRNCTMFEKGKQFKNIPQAFTSIHGAKQTYKHPDILKTEMLFRAWKSVNPRVKKVAPGQIFESLKS